MVQVAFAKFVRFNDIDLGLGHDYHWCFAMYYVVSERSESQARFKVRFGSVSIFQGCLTSHASLLKYTYLG